MKNKIFKICVCMIVIVCVMSFALSLGNPTIYTKERWLSPQGDKAKEIQVRMIFDSEKLIVQDKKNGSLLFEIPWDSIKGLTYSKSKHPRWKTGLGTAALIGVFAIPFFFMKGKKHWLTVQHSEEMTAFRLDKNTYNMVTAEFEAKTGLVASRIED